MLEGPFTFATLGLASLFGAILSIDVVKVWVVFFLCFVFSAIGVLVSFLILGSTIGGSKPWVVGSLIALVMLGVTYGAKYANAQSRKEFTPVDLIQYTSQGFLWPSAWPSLAAALGVRQIEPPTTASWLQNATDLISTFFS